MPQPLDYASPQVNRRRSIQADVPVIFLCAIQIFISVLTLMFGTVQPAVREATWYALIAYHWAAEVGLVNLVASIVLFVGAFRPVGLRKRSYVIGTILLLMSCLWCYTSLQILDTSGVWLANGPATVPVNDPRFRPTFDDQQDDRVAIAWMTCVLILFGLRGIVLGFSMLARFVSHDARNPGD